MEHSVSRKSTKVSIRSQSIDGNMSKTYTPGSGLKGKVVQGKVTVHVLEAEKLTIPEGVTNVKPFVRLSAGEVSHDSEVAVGSYLQMWRDQSFTFQVLGKTTVEIKVYHKRVEQDQEHDFLGETTISIEQKTDCGQKWLPLSQTTGGQIKLKWSYEEESPAVIAANQQQQQINTVRRLTNSSSFGASFDKSGEEKESDPDVLGKLKLEIIRAKSLTTPQYWISFSPYVTCSYQGSDHETKVQKNTTNPFYNFKMEIDVKDTDPVLFYIKDSNTTGSGDGQARDYGCVGWAYDTAVSMKTNVVSLQVLQNLDDVEPPEDLGVLEIRVSYKSFASRKKSTENGDPSSVQNGLISLGYQPVINGSVSIVPQDCQYIWYNMYDDAKFKMTMEQKVIEAYLSDQLKQTASPGRLRPRLSTTTSVAAETRRNDPVPLTMDSVVTHAWGCTRMHHVLDMARLCGEKISGCESLPISPSDLHALRVKLAEMTIMRTQVIRGSASISNTLKALWYLFTTGSTIDTKETHVEPDFGEIHYKALATHFLQTFVPGLSAGLADELANTEWEVVGSSGRDDTGTLMLEPERFYRHISFFASLWCDTLTEYEVQQYLSVSTPVVVEARKTVLRLTKKKVKAKIVKEGFKKPEHLDELGHRQAPQSRRKSSATKKSPSPRHSKKTSTVSVKSRGSTSGPPPRPPESFQKDDDEDENSPMLQNTNDYYESTLRSLRKGSADSFGSYSDLTKVLNQSDKPHHAKTKRKSRKSLASTSSMRHKKKRSAFDVAEEKVKHAFEMEDFDWRTVSTWAKDVFGGWEGDNMSDVLNMSHSEVDMIILRLFPAELPKKHPKVRNDLIAAVVTFFQTIKPKAEVPPEQQGAKVGQSNIPEGCLRIISAFCGVQELKKLVAGCRMTKMMNEGLLMERVERMYPLPGEGDLENALKAVFTQTACAELRQQVGMGKLKAPPRLAQVVAEMACTILSIETNGYWAKFREVICNPSSYSHFSDYSPATLTSTLFHACSKLKEDTDTGIDRQGRQLNESMRGLSWVTLTEETLSKAVPDALVSLYKWVKLLMMAYSRHSGKTYFYIDTYGWTHRASKELFWD